MLVIVTTLLSLLLIVLFVWSGFFGPFGFIALMAIETTVMLALRDRTEKRDQ